jgi:tRNA(Ile)-lysidine synthase
MCAAAAQSSGPIPLQNFRPPPPSGKILVAVSGGLDSMVLLHALKILSKAHRWKLVVAHFNHCLRGRASDADEALVRKTAAAMKLPLVAGRAEVKRFAKESKLSIEMAARKLRHEFFVRTAKERRIKTIALAHHSDDQVELFFLRLLRGAGGSGLAGMKGRSPSPVDRSISLVRPLLDLSKSELLQYACENKIRHREDESNLSHDFLRNRIRHELLPLLRRNYQPSLNKAVLRLMDIVGAEADSVDEAARKWLQSSQARTKFEKLRIAIQRHVIKLQLIELGIAADFELVESLRKSANQPISISTNFTVSRDGAGRLALREQPERKFDESQLTLKLNRSGRAAFDDVKFRWQFAAHRRRLDKVVKVTAQPGVECFDADKMGGGVILRHWCEGDRFQPIGMKASVKLQDLFTNLKIPRDRRHRLVLAETNDEIFWVEGLRISENFKLTPQTKRLLVWSWQR